MGNFSAGTLLSLRRLDCHADGLFEGNCAGIIYNHVFAPKSHESAAPSFSDQKLCQVRRAWRKYGILWLGAVLVGLIAVLYAWLMDVGFGMFRSMQQSHFWLPLFITPAIGALCVWATRRYFPGSEGSGIPQVIATLEEDTSKRGLDVQPAAFLPARQCGIESVIG